MKELKEVNNFEDLPKDIQEEVYDNLREDILERYDNTTYYDQDIIHNTLMDKGYKLKDDSQV